VSAAFAEWSREFLAVDLSSDWLAISDGSRADALPSAMSTTCELFTVVVTAHAAPFGRTFRLHRSFPRGVVRMRVKAEGVTVFAMDFRGADVSSVKPTQRLLRRGQSVSRAITRAEGRRRASEPVTVSFVRLEEYSEVHVDAELQGVMATGQFLQNVCVARDHHVQARLKHHLRPLKEVLIAFQFAELPGDPGFRRGVCVERS